MDLSLVLVKPDGSMRELNITRSPRIIGRTDAADIRVAAPDVSRKHCQISIDEDEEAAFIKDLGSSNGTFVNGERVVECELSPGDLVSVGPAVFVVRMTGFPKDIDAVASYRKGRPGASEEVVAPRSKPAASTSADTASATRPPSKPAAKPVEGDSEDSSFFDFILDDNDEPQPRL